jgi:hypothetical protein
LKAVSTQASVEIATWKRARISGSASVTTDESARTIPTDRPSSALGAFAFVARDPKGRGQTLAVFGAT